MNEKEMLEKILNGMQGMQQDIKEIKEDVAVLKQDVSGLKQDVTVLKQDVAGLKQDVAGLKQDVTVLKQDVAGLKQDVAGLKQDVSSLKQRVTAIELHLENKTDHFLNILAENHISLIDQLNKSIPAADKSQLYEIRVNFLTDKVNKLEKEVTDIKTKIA